MDTVLRRKSDCIKGRCVTSCQSVIIGQCLLHEKPLVCVSSSSEYLQDFSLNNFETTVFSHISQFPYAHVSVLVARWIKYQSKDLVQRDIINELSRTVSSHTDDKLSYSLCQAIKSMASTLFNDDELIIMIDKFRTNAFTLVDDNCRNIGVAMYANASSINHDCDPNCCQSFDKHTGELFIHAIRPIECDEHITIAYIDCGKPLWWRRHLLATQYGFFCTCNRCQAEEKMMMFPTNLPSSFADTFLCGNCSGICTVKNNGDLLSSSSNNESEMYLKWLACDGSLESFSENSKKLMNVILSSNLNMETLFCQLSLPLGFLLYDLKPNARLLNMTLVEMSELDRKYQITCNICHSSRSLKDVLCHLSRICQLISFATPEHVSTPSNVTDKHWYESSKYSEALSLIREIVHSNHCCITELQYKLCRSLKQSIWYDFNVLNELDVSKTSECFSQFHSLFSSINIVYAYENREKKQQYKHITVVIVLLDLADFILEANHVRSVVGRIKGNPQTLESCLNLRYAKELYETAYRSLCISHGKKHTLTKEVNDKMISLS